MTIPPWLDQKGMSYAVPIALNDENSDLDPMFIAMMCFWLSISTLSIDYHPPYWPRRPWN